MYAVNDSQIHKDYVTRFISGIVEAKVSAGNGDGVYKITADPRVTRVGRFLRKTSLDELPSFSMSSGGRCRWSDPARRSRMSSTPTISGTGGDCWK